MKATRKLDIWSKHGSFKPLIIEKEECVENRLPPKNYTYTDDMGLFVPRRLAGTLTVHEKEMHAVSRLLSGVRYSLFVVDITNGLGGETANIHINVRICLRSQCFWTFLSSKQLYITYGFVDAWRILAPLTRCTLTDTADIHRLCQDLIEFNKKKKWRLF